MIFDAAAPQDWARIHGAARVHDSTGRIPVVYADEDGPSRDGASIDAAWAAALANGEPESVTRGKVHEAAERLYVYRMVAEHVSREAHPASRTGNGVYVDPGYCYLEQAILMGLPAYGWHQPHADVAADEPLSVDD